MNRALACAVFATAALTLVAQEPPPADGPAFPVISGETILVPADTRLLKEPDRRARSVAVVDTPTELVVLERRGRWVLVRYQSWKVWFDTSGDEPEDPALEPVTIAPDFDPEQLRRGRKLLGEPVPRAVGPFVIHTDLKGGALLESLTRLALHLPAAYHERYGLPAAAVGDSAILVFADEEEYRAFAGGKPVSGADNPRGHAAGGLAAMSAEGNADDTRAVLVHELTHLLNRHALGQELPPWLEEGLAEELSFGDFRSDGTLKPGTLRGEVLSRSAVCRLPDGTERPCQEHRVRGPQAAVNKLAARPGPLGTLLELPSLAFSEPSARAGNYAASALFVRYLLDGEKGARAPAFRAFLLDVARGGSPGTEALAARLGVPISALDEGYATFVRRLRRDR